MSRTTFVRRLTAVIALLALFCLAVPATAATPGAHPTKSPTASSASLLDEFIVWLASLGFGPSPAARPTPNKSTSLMVSPAGLGHNPDSADASQGMDPNGHQ
jgi:hypothetical protein